jgi:hypothetical protein
MAEEQQLDTPPDFGLAQEEGRGGRGLARARTHYQRLRGLQRNGPVQGGKVREYVNISSLFDVAVGHFGQIPQGRRNGFHLGPKAAWKGNQPSRRAFRTDMFAISAPRWRW